MLRCFFQVSITLNLNGKAHLFVHFPILSHKTCSSVEDVLNEAYWGKFGLKLFEIMPHYSELDENNVRRAVAMQPRSAALSENWEEAETASNLSQLFKQTHSDSKLIQENLPTFLKETRSTLYTSNGAMPERESWSLIAKSANDIHLCFVIGKKPVGHFFANWRKKAIKTSQAQTTYYIKVHDIHY